MSTIPADLKYTKDHEWVRVEGNVATIGITEYAQSELGDIVFVEVNGLDDDFDQEETFGAVEAVKTVSDLFMPVSGKLTEVNESLADDPGLVNNDPYGEGWMIKVELKDSSELDGLLDSAAYGELIGA